MMWIEKLMFVIMLLAYVFVFAAGVLVEAAIRSSKDRKAMERRIENERWQEMHEVRTRLNTLEEKVGVDK